MVMEGLTFLQVTGVDINQWLEPIAELRLRIFRDFPYLYEGSFDDEKDYLQTYTQCPDALAILLLSKRRVVGVSTGLPMMAETEDFTRPFTDAGKDISRLFYGGESLLNPEFRGQGVYRHFIERREQYARQLGMRQLTFCAVDRASDHPLRPPEYVPLDTVWRKFGYQIQPQLKASYWWRDTNHTQASLHTLTYWLKTL